MLHNIRYILESELGVEHPVKEPPRILPAADSGEEIPHHLRNVSGLLYDRRNIKSCMHNLRYILESELVKNLISKSPQLMGIELEEKVPMEVIIKMTETGPVYKNTKTGLLHNLRYILESELGVEHPIEEPPRILPASDSGEEIPRHLRNVSGLLYDRHNCIISDTY